MPQKNPLSDAEVTARLVEQLARTTERLEKLEATLREVSLLTALQREPVTRDAVSTPADSADNTLRLPENGKLSYPAGENVQKAEAHFRRGVALCQAGKFDEAVAAWQEVLRLQPENAYALANIGIVYTEQARWPEAHEMFTRVLRVLPDNSEAYYGLGMANAQLGDYAAAAAAWENTLRLRPDNADARYNLTLVRQRLALDNIASPASDKADTDKPSVSQRSTDPWASMPFPGEDPEFYSSVLNGKHDQTSENAEPILPDALEAASASQEDSRRPETSGVEEVFPVSKKRLSGNRQRRLLGIGGIVIAAATLAGFLFYSRFHPARPLAVSSNAAPAVQTPENAGAALPKTTSPLASKPEEETRVRPSAPESSKALSIHLSPLPALVTRQKPKTPAPHPRSKFAARPSHPHSRAVHRVLRAVPRPPHFRPHKGSSSNGQSNPGYNQGIDKLLEKLP